MLFSRLRLGVLLAFALCSAACQLTPSEASSRKNGHETAIPALSQFLFEGVLQVPMAEQAQELTVNPGPLLITHTPYPIAYRVIGADELEFVGTTKTVYKFFNAAFTQPIDDVERAFAEGLGGAIERIRPTSNNLEMYSLIKPSQSKLYVISKKLDFALEIAAETTDASFTRNLAEKILLKNGKH